MAADDPGYHAATVLLALESPELVLMLLSFGGMVGFALLALWLWRRQQASSGQTSTRASQPPRSGSSAAPEPESSREPAPESTDFVAVPGRREADAPQADESGTELVEPLHDDSAGASQSGRTELVTPIFDGDGGREPEPDERTAMIPAGEIAARHGAGRPSLDATEFLVPPSTEPEPEHEKTEFIAPLPSFAPPAPAVRAPAPAVRAPAPAVRAPAPAVRAPAPALRAPAPAVTPPAPAVTPPAPAVRAPAPSTPSFDLREHLSLALASFEQLELGSDEARATELGGHVEVLGSAAAGELLALVRPELEREPGPRLVGAVQILLASKTWSARSALGPLLAELDPPRREAALLALRSWDDPRASDIGLAGLAAATDDELRLAWLTCCAEAGWDPGVAAIEAALGHADPAVVAAGLRLIPRAAAADDLQSDLAGHLFAPMPAVRMQAIETALSFANQSAWLVCRQLGRNPSFPVAAELVGLLGTEVEVAELDRALDAAPLPQLLVGLGLSGRAAGARACIARFGDDDPGVREAARAGLAIVSGRSFETAAEAQAWLDSQGSFTRLVAGAPRTGEQLLAVLADAGPPLRRAVARELRIRTRGRAHLDPTLVGRAWRRQLAGFGPRLPAAFDRGFPWAQAEG